VAFAAFDPVEPVPAQEGGPEDEDQATPDQATSDEQSTPQ
jgi:hypothetical protein